MVKAGLAVALAVYWMGCAGPIPTGPSATLSFTNWLAVGLALAREMILGAILGFALGLFILPARIAGEYLGQGMGLAVAATADRMAADSSAVIAQVFEMLATLIFLGMDGHHLFLAALNGTLTRWPLGGSGLPLHLPALVDGAARTQEWGLLIAAPVSACLFITSVALALMMRVAPQLNIFSVGFPLQIGVGLGVAVLFLPQLLAAIVSVFGHVNVLVHRLL
jgi:flagellar biosynthetic protein FliR